MTERVAPSDVFQAIADPNRRRLLDLLRGEERPVAALVPHLGVSFGAVSQHLAILLRANLVTRRRSGRQRLYRANPAGLRPVAEWTDQYRRFWDVRFDRLDALVGNSDSADARPPSPRTKGDSS